MPIDPETAARIAKENGLQLADVPALRSLANTEDEAHQLAAQFAPTAEGEEIAKRIMSRGKL